MKKIVYILLLICSLLVFVGCDKKTEEQPIPKLDTPVVTISDSGLASWETVENAANYKYRIGETFSQITSKLSVQLNDGETICVMALGDGKTYLDSDFSEPLKYVKPVAPTEGKTEDETTEDILTEDETTEDLPTEDMPSDIPSDDPTTNTPTVDHTCDFSGEWVKDETHHWHECSCGEIDEKVSHSGGEATTTAKAVCEVCGEEYGEFAKPVYEGELAPLKTLFDSIGSVYSTQTNVYFNSNAVEQINNDFNMNFYCNLNSIYTSNYIYHYSDDLVVNDGYVTKDGNLYQVKLKGNSLNEKLNSVINANDLVKVNDKSLSDLYFSLNNLNGEYVDKYGSTTVDFSSSISFSYDGWSKVSDNKFKCDRLEVCQDLLTLCAPTYPLDDEFFMTFSYVIVELNPNDDAVLRIRLYTSETQVGKLVEYHLDKTNSDTYLLFAEAYVSKVDNVSIKAFEDLK